MNAIQRTDLHVAKGLIEQTRDPTISCVGARGICARLIGKGKEWYAAV